MCPLTYSILFAIFGFISWWLIHARRATTAWSPYRGLNLPPGPPGLPIIGNLHMLGTLPHRTLYELSRKYGPIMSLRLGNVPTIVVSSPEAAELFLKTHDTIFASRPKTQAGELVSYGTKGMAFTPYCSHWRNIRKFCTLELLSTRKIDSLSGMRREELVHMVKSIKEAAAAREVVDVTEKVEEVIVDMTCRMLFGKSKDERFDLSGVFQELSHLGGAFNMADYLPFLRPFDLQGLTRCARRLKTTLDKILETIINEHEEVNIENKSNDSSFVSAILSLRNKATSTQDQLSYIMDRTNMKATLIDMIFGAVDTSTTSIDWIMTELMRHPTVMRRLQDELKMVVGDNEMVEESHLHKLEYLNMVVKEGLRLHPVAPLLVPHESMEDIAIDGYYIPNKSRIIINSWALGRDPKAWSENADEFLPERFVGSKIDLHGRDFELIPFGSGRRGCPGMHLGLINIKLVVSQMVHSFDWDLPQGISSEMLDMDEKFGLTVVRANHLLAMPTVRGGQSLK